MTIFPLIVRKFQPKLPSLVEHGWFNFAKIQDHFGKLCQAVTEITNKSISYFGKNGLNKATFMKGSSCEFRPIEKLLTFAIKPPPPNIGGKGRIIG